MKVLIVKLSAFGDIVHALPALDDVMQNPLVDEVHWLVDSRFSFVTELFPASVKVHKVALKGERAVQHAWRMVQGLRQEHFDVIIDLQGLIKSGLMAWLSCAGSCRVLGFDRNQSPEWPNRWLVESVPFHVEERHVVQIYRRMAQSIGKTSSELKNPQSPVPYQEPRIQLTEPMLRDGEECLEQLMGSSDSQSMPLTLIHVGGSYSTKRMHDLQWAALLEKLDSQSRTLILWGSEEERERAQKISQNREHVVVAPQVLPLTSLVGIFQHTSAYIGQDTGMTHLAAACQCPTVTLWGPTAAWRMGPQGKDCRQVTADVACAPCFSRRCEHFICMPSIASDSIIQAWQEIRR